MTYGMFKDLSRRTIGDKKLCDIDKYLILQKFPKYDRYQCGFSSMAYKFFDKKTTLFADKSASNTNKGTKIYSDVLFENKKLSKELHKTIIRKLGN